MSVCVSLAGVARCSMAASNGYILKCTVYMHRHVCKEVGEGFLHCRNVHNCHCALQTSGLAGNSFHKGLVVNPLCDFTAKNRRVLYCSLKGIGHPTSV